MRFKAFEVYVDRGEYNSSMFAIEERADRLVNDWLEKNPNVRIHHFSQCLANIDSSRSTSIPASSMHGTTPAGHLLRTYDPAPDIQGIVTIESTKA